MDKKIVMKLKRVVDRFSIDGLLLLILLLEVTVFSLLDIRGLGNRILVCAVIFRIFFLRKPDKVSILSAILIFLLISVYTLSAINGKAFHAKKFYENFRALIYTLAPTLYIAWLRKERADYFDHVMEQQFAFINIFYFINFCIMCVQGVVPGFLSGRSDYVNTYVPDLMSGLFGYNGTAQFGIFSVFMLIYDLYCFLFLDPYKKFPRAKKWAIMLFLICLVSISAMMNDNKAVYITLAFAFLLCVTILVGRYKRAARYTCLALGLFCAGVVILIVIEILSGDLSFFYRISPEFGGTIYLIRNLFRDISTHNSGEIGSIERVYMIVYVLFHPEYLMFGAGTAYSNWQTPGTLGFPHFGQSDMSSFLCLGGLTFCVTCFVVYFAFYRIILGRCKKNKGVVYITQFLFVLFYYFYTQPWTQSSLSICIAFLFVPFGMMVERVNEEMQ